MKEHLNMWSTVHDYLKLSKKITIVNIILKRKILNSIIGPLFKKINIVI
jgi:hypothetical protein